jgi:hypothetical protein
MKDGGPAFPREFHSTNLRIYESQDGMSLRDYFAAAALSMGEGVWVGPHMPENADAIAKNAYALADAMLKARESTS